MTKPLQLSKTVNFADVAHGTLIFNRSSAPESIILQLIDTKWVQRLRRISQTGNTRYVYMFAEHSRFGHSLGVAYLATLLLQHLKQLHPDQVAPYELAISCAAILHDVGHLSPGSHLAEYVWQQETPMRHEQLTRRVLLEDPEIYNILSTYDAALPALVDRILSEDSSLPPWVVSVISGGAWNADRGNWSIVDSIMCAVSYGKYNVTALIDAFRLTTDGELVIQESRLDALTHFFVARNSMYRQVYQHRVLQTADEMTKALIVRVREIFKEHAEGIFVDSIMQQMLSSHDYISKVALADLFQVDEHWWHYHLTKWCSAPDAIVADLATRLRDRRLFKTITLSGLDDEDIIAKAAEACGTAGLDANFYCLHIQKKDTHKAKRESPPRVLTESGSLASAEEIEPLVRLLSERSSSLRAWVAVPEQVKQALGMIR